VTVTATGDNTVPRPKVSVYVVSHNYGRFLGEAIESVLRQHYENWELLVIDDGSTDHTPDVVQLYVGDPRVRAYRTEGIGLPSTVRGRAAVEMLVAGIHARRRIKRSGTARRLYGRVPRPARG